MAYLTFFINYEMCVHSCVKGTLEDSLQKAVSLYHLDSRDRIWVSGSGLGTPLPTEPVTNPVECLNQFFKDFGKKGP